MRGLLSEWRKQIRAETIDDLSNILKKNYDYLPQILSQKAFDGYIDEIAEKLRQEIDDE